MVSKSLEELVDTAPVVVYGKVVALEENPLTGHRTAVFEVLEVARAPEEFKSQRDFLVPLYSRKIPGKGIRERVVGAPELKIHEELVLFLRPIAKTQEGSQRRSDGQRLFALEGFHQGKLSVVEDDQGARRVRLWNEEPLSSQGSSSGNSGFAAKSLGTPSDNLRQLSVLMNRARAGAHE